MSMAKEIKSITLLEEKVINKIYLIRDKKVILDFDLAKMYTVETKQLKRQVKRNPERFPKDFMFALAKKEFENLRGANWHLKLGWNQIYANGFYRARRCHVIKCFK